MAGKHARENFKLPAAESITLCLGIPFSPLVAFHLVIGLRSVKGKENMETER